MILADKIIQLRKKNGWSQEELADQLNVTRQSVSKWEGAQSVPDLERILQMSRIFGVSTDYLLKDDLGVEEYVESQAGEENSPVRRVSMEEAGAFLEIKRITAGQIALAVDLCILSPICLLLLGAACETPGWQVSENLAGGLGLIILILMVTVAVAVFISCGMRTSPFEYLEKEQIETEYGVAGMVRERQRQYRNTYARYNMTGTCLCILSVIPLFATVFSKEEDVFVYTAGVALLLCFVAVGVYFFVVAGINWESMQKLLQEGDYTRRAKANRRSVAPVASIYWCVVTAIYLGWSLYSNAWDRTWIIWAVAGVLFAAVVTAVGLFQKKD